MCSERRNRGTGAVPGTRARTRVPTGERLYYPLGTGRFRWAAGTRRLDDPSVQPKNLDYPSFLDGAPTQPPDNRSTTTRQPLYNHSDGIPVAVADATIARYGDAAPVIAPQPTPPSHVAMPLAPVA